MPPPNLLPPPSYANCWTSKATQHWVNMWQRSNDGKAPDSSSILVPKSCILVWWEWVDNFDDYDTKTKVWYIQGPQLEADPIQRTFSEVCQELATRLCLAFNRKYQRKLPPPAPPTPQWNGMYYVCPRCNACYETERQSAMCLWLHDNP